MVTECADGDSAIAAIREHELDLVFLDVQMPKTNGFDVVRAHGDALVPIADEWTRGWAAAEERMIKTAVKTLSALDSDGAPWFEVYARRDE